MDLVSIGNLVYIVTSDHEPPICNISCFYQTVNDWCNFPLTKDGIQCACKLALPHCQSVKPRCPCVWRRHLHRLFIRSLTNSDFPTRSDFPPISWPWYRVWPSPIMSGFHGPFATGVACQQGTLTLPDTWFRPPFWDLLMLQLLWPDSSILAMSLLDFSHRIRLGTNSRFCIL